MANPRFTDSSGNTSYTWTILPDVPGSRPDLNVRLGREIYTIEHFRNNVISARAVTASSGKWTFLWVDISWAMVLTLRKYAEMDTFRYYPDADDEINYYKVFIPKDTGFMPTNKRGGVYDLLVTVKEYRSVGLVSISSSSSISSHSSSSSSSSSLSSSCSSSCCCSSMSQSCFSLSCTSQSSASQSSASFSSASVSSASVSSGSQSSASSQSSISQSSASQSSASQSSISQSSTSISSGSQSSGSQSSHSTPSEGPPGSG
jgi:hypothetical protein